MIERNALNYAVCHCPKLIHCHSTQLEVIQILWLHLIICMIVVPDSGLFPNGRTFFRCVDALFSSCMLLSTKSYFFISLIDNLRNMSTIVSSSDEVIKSTREGRLYILTKDCFRQQKVQNMVFQLLNSDLVKDIEAYQKQREQEKKKESF